MRIDKFQEVGPVELKELVRQTSRKLHTAVIHCSATRLSQDISAEEIEKWHKSRGFNEIGYNLYITKDGKMWKGRNWNKVPAHVAGFNSSTLGISYEGGLDEDAKPLDTRTKEQKKSLRKVYKILTKGFAEKGIELGWKGHRDFSPDKDGDGIVEPWEWMKACPCFSVSDFVNKMKENGSN